jgi:hypothetical protein
MVGIRAREARRQRPVKGDRENGKVRLGENGDASAKDQTAVDRGRGRDLLCGSTIERVDMAGSPPARNIAWTLANSSGVCTL